MSEQTLKREMAEAKAAAEQAREDLIAEVVARVVEEFGLKAKKNKKEKEDDGI